MINHFIQHTKKRFLIFRVSKWGSVIWNMHCILVRVCLLLSIDELSYLGCERIVFITARFLVCWMSSTRLMPLACERFSMDTIIPVDGVRVNTVTLISIHAKLRLAQETKILCFNYDSSMLVYCEFTYLWTLVICICTIHWMTIPVALKLETILINRGKKKGLQ